METTLIAPRIFVTALSSPVAGQWFDVDEYSDADELTQAIADYFQAPAGEYLVKGYEGFTSLLYSERMDLNAMYKYLDIVDEFNPSPDSSWYEALGVYLKAKTITYPTAETIQSFDDAYQGHFSGVNPKRAFTISLINMLAEETCDPESVKRHFNVASFQKELFTSNYWEQAGHIFAN